MEINPNEVKKGSNQFDKPKETSKESEANAFIKLTSESGADLSPKELEYHFSELLKNLSSDIAKAKNQYASIQKDYQQNLFQQTDSSRSEQRELKTNYLGQLNGVIGELKETMEERISHVLESVGVNRSSDDLMHQVLQTINDPTIKEAYTAKFVKDPGNSFLFSAKKERSFESLIKETDTKMACFAKTSPSTPQPPTTIQELESQLSQLATSGPDRNTQVLASVVLGEVKTLDGKGLSLTTIESWAYAAIVGKMTSNSEYSTGFANLNPSEQTLFKTLTGIDQFQGKFSSHSFTTAQVTDTTAQVTETEILG